MTDREAMQMALDALNNVYITSNETFHTQTVKTLRTALAQFEPEPVAWAYKVNNTWEQLSFIEPPNDAYDDDSLVPLYTTLPQREWRGLTDEERKDIFKVCAINDRGYVAAMVEAKLREKNT